MQERSKNIATNVADNFSYEGSINFRFKQKVLVITRGISNSSAKKFSR